MAALFHDKADDRGARPIPQHSRTCRPTARHAELRRAPLPRGPATDAEPRGCPEGRALRRSSARRRCRRRRPRLLQLGPTPCLTGLGALEFEITPMRGAPSRRWWPGWCCRCPGRLPRGERSPRARPTPARANPSRMHGVPSTCLLLHRRYRLRPRRSPRGCSGGSPSCPGRVAFEVRDEPRTGADGRGPPPYPCLLQPGEEQEGRPRGHDDADEQHAGGDPLAARVGTSGEEQR